MDKEKDLVRPLEILGSLIVIILVFLLTNPILAIIIRIFSTTTYIITYIIGGVITSLAVLGMIRFRYRYFSCSTNPKAEYNWPNLKRRIYYLLLYSTLAGIFGAALLSLLPFIWDMVGETLYDMVNYLLAMFDADISMEDMYGLVSLFLLGLLILKAIRWIHPKKPKISYSNPL